MPLLLDGHLLVLVWIVWQGIIYSVHWYSSIEKTSFIVRAQTFHSLAQERMDYLEGMMGDSADLHNKVAGFMV